MKERTFAFLFSTIATLCLVAMAQDSKPAKPPEPRVVQIPKPLLDNYATAQQRTAEARRIVEDSPVWKNYIILQNQEQTTLIAIMSEVGIKAYSDRGCIPIHLKDGKKTLDNGTPVNEITGTLDHFECPPVAKPEEKPKP